RSSDLSSSPARSASRMRAPGASTPLTMRSPIRRNTPSASRCFFVSLSWISIRGRPTSTIIPTIPQTVTARGAPNAPYCYSKHSSGSPGSAGRTAMWWGISAVVDELQVDVQIAALEQGDDGLQIVAALGLHAQLVALDLALDALGALVADDLADLLRVLGRDAVLERGDDAVLLAAGEGDRKSTRLNSSHVKISYAVFCLKKTNIT